MSRPRSDLGKRLARGVQALFEDRGYVSLLEVNLKIRRRVDVMGINAKGRIMIAEVKSGPADFRVDEKWPDYLAFCDEFYFAVDENFPTELLPTDHGLIIADEFHAEILRPSQDFSLNGTRRRNITLRFARQAAQRLRAVQANPTST